MEGFFSYSIFPLGDSAITIDLGNCIEEQHNIRALALHDWLRAHRFPGMLDIIVAYSSVSVFYDPAVIRADHPEDPGGAFARVRDLLVHACEAVEGAVANEGRETVEGAVAIEGREAGADGPGLPVAAPHGRLFRIPVCYQAEYAPDLDWVTHRTGLSREEVIGIHCAITYRVYMIGFLPGFCYMGRVDPRLELPRKQRPVTVVAGGVGIAGMQTGIYPLNSPGGWQIIGRTPVQLFDPQADPPVRLQSGDQVQFYPVSAVEFGQLRPSGLVSPFI